MKAYQIDFANLPDIEELEDVETHNLTRAAVVSYTFKAICTSEECCGKKIGIQKNVARSEDVCPDCGYYLFWDKQAVA